MEKSSFFRFFSEAIFRKATIIKSDASFKSKRMLAYFLLLLLLLLSHQKSIHLRIDEVNNGKGMYVVVACIDNVFVIDTIHSYLCHQFSDRMALVCFLLLLLLLFVLSIVSSICFRPFFAYYIALLALFHCACVRTIEQENRLLDSAQCACFSFQCIQKSLLVDKIVTLCERERVILLNCSIYREKKVTEKKNPSKYQQAAFVACIHIVYTSQHCLDIVDDFNRNG